MGDGGVVVGGRWRWGKPEPGRVPFLVSFSRGGEFAGGELSSTGEGHEGKAGLHARPVRSEYKAGLHAPVGDMSELLGREN